MPDPTLFNQALHFFWRPENDGQAFHFTPDDAGGATAWGATFASYTAWRVLHDTDAPGGTLAEFRAMEPEDFSAFYRSGYWNPVHGDELPAGVGLVVFDAAAMSGVSRASRWLQRAAGADQDGAIGPATLEAVAAFDPRELIARFTNIRRDFYDQIVANNSSQARFLKGWRRRANDGEIAALAAVEGAGA